MVRFYGLCDGKIMVKKQNFLNFCVKRSSFFRKNVGACYLICKYQRLNTCKLCNEGFLISFLIHGKSMVRVFG